MPKVDLPGSGLSVSFLLSVLILSLSLSLYDHTRTLVYTLLMAALNRKNESLMKKS